VSDDQPKRHAPKGPIKSHDPSVNRYPSVPQCTAPSRRSGQRCQRHAIRGGTVCIMHGGKAPQVQRKAEDAIAEARLRLRGLLDPAVTRLAQLVEQQGFPSTAMAAVKDVLDRNMGRSAETVNMELSGSIDVVDVLKRRFKRAGYEAPDETPAE